MNSKDYVEIEEGFYFIKPLAQNNFLDCMGYVVNIEGKAFLIQKDFSPLEIVATGKFEDAKRERSGEISPMEIEKCRNPQSMRYSYQSMIDFIDEYMKPSSEQSEQALVELIQQLDKMKPKKVK